MHNFSIKKSLSVAKTEYLKWLLNPRMIIVLIMLIFIKTCAIDPLISRSIEMKSKLNILEPFIAIGNSGVILLIVPLAFLTLISDFPRTDGNTLFFITRTGKNNWLIGQIVFFFMSILSFFTTIMIGSVVPIITKSFSSNSWSDVVTKYDTMFPQKAGGFASELVPGNLYNQMSPVSAALQTYLLLILYMFVLALIMLLFNLLKMKTLGIFTAGVVIAFGVAGCSLKASIMWLFPMANSIIWLHYTEYYRANKARFLFIHIFCCYYCFADFYNSISIKKIYA